MIYLKIRGRAGNQKGMDHKDAVTLYSAAGGRSVGDVSWSRLKTEWL